MDQTTASSNFSTPVLPTESAFEPLDPKRGVILFFIILPGIIGNIFSLAATANILKLQVKVAPNYYVFALSSIDLLLLIACCTPTLVCYVAGEWKGGQMLCDFQGVMSLFCSISSGSVAALLAVDRFFAVTKPFLYRSQITVRLVETLILCAVLLSLAVSLLPTFGFGSFQMNLTGTYCTINWFSTSTKHIVYSYMYACIGLGLVAAIVTVNIIVIVSLLSERRKKTKIFNADLSSTITTPQGKSENNSLGNVEMPQLRAGQQSSVPTSAPSIHSITRSYQVSRRVQFYKQTNLEVRAVKLSIAISVVFLFCWVPFMVSFPKYDISYISLFLFEPKVKCSFAKKK